VIETLLRLLLSLIGIIAGVLTVYAALHGALLPAFAFAVIGWCCHGATRTYVEVLP